MADDALLPLEISPKNIIAGKSEFQLWNEIVETAKKLCAGISDPIEKARAIYDFLNQNRDGAVFAYDEKAIRGEGFARRAVETWAEKKGDCDEMAYLFVAMARAAGLEAGFVDVAELETPGTVKHGCACIFVENGDEQLNYRRFSEDFSFRSRTLSIAGIGGNNLAMALIDPTVGIFGAQYLKADYMGDVGADFYNKRGYSLGQKGEYERALGEYEKVILLVRGIGRYENILGACHYNKGYTLMKLGRLDEAEKSFREALKYIREKEPVMIIERYLFEIDSSRKARGISH